MQPTFSPIIVYKVNEGKWPNSNNKKQATENSGSHPPASLYVALGRYPLTSIPDTEPAMDHEERSHTF